MQEFLDQVVRLFSHLGTGVLSLVPTVVVILILVVVQRLLSRQSSRNTGLRFRNQLIMAGVIFVGVLLIIVALPVGTDLKGQLLTLVGIIASVTISLSSSTFLGNAMAGIMLKAVRNFRSGDFIAVGDHFGRVTERGLFHTEIQTASRDLTTLPNLFIATNPVTVTRASGTIVDATVSLGYDVPHGRIERLLLEAAGATGLSDPFVQVLDLGDYAVTYRVAGLLEDTKRLLTFRSRLRTAVLDALHGDGVEIVSPAFLNRREVAPGQRFVPRRPEGPPAAGADADVQVIFDKAEEAASLEKLRAMLAETENGLADLTAAVKAADGDTARAAAERNLATAQKRREILLARVEAAEKREAEKDG